MVIKSIGWIMCEEFILITSNFKSQFYKDELDQTRPCNEPNQFENSLKFDLKIKLLN